MTWRIEDRQCAESLKIRWEAVPYLSGLGLDIGCGPNKVLPHCIGVDSNIDEQIFGIRCNPDMRVPDASSLPMYATESMDFVFSSHLLEHIQDHVKALKEWWRLVKVGGFLILYLPHKKFYPNIGVEGANPDHKHDFLPKDIIEVMKDCGGWNLLENQDREQANEYSFYQVYEKRADQKQKQPWTSPKPKKTAAVCRYGAFGDLLQTASITKALKADGYHITLFCETRGFEIAKTDPNVDKFIVQQKDVVPNTELGPYWDYWTKKFDRYINLSESVEASVLALPDRMQARWPQSMRHKYMNRNYLEFMHDVSETRYEWFKDGQRFYATAEEKDWAKAERDKIQGPAILWPLAGSSVHKTWAGGVWPIKINGEDKEVTGFDTIVGRLMAATEATVVMVGDTHCQIIEAPWEKSERVWKRSGIWTIRETLAFAEICDIVIGPETGVLNAVAFHENVAKIVFLSHSTIENLTRDWKNTMSLVPQDTPCYPCHMMHYSWDTCKRQAHGEALCQKNINFDRVWEALCRNIDIKHFKMPERRIVGE